MTKKKTKLIHIVGWCAYNADEVTPPINEISYEKSEAKARKRWKGQKISKVFITILDDYEEDLEK